MTLVAVAVSARADPLARILSYLAYFIHHWFIANDILIVE
ncbi:Uncharacterised protein [Proteus mirabilis]|uniref:Uncharacterized protein n=1 Tax=Proteus mirabilis TaxID=584 RepID=A0A379GGK4_PROMI|nr:hypothetical protein HMPREF0693_1276 [Proteus mirabilis ATCC 29906]SUC40082.1 Uncharacterised protein [Proteus mirabilis]